MRFRMVMPERVVTHMRYTNCNPRDEETEKISEQTIDFEAYSLEFKNGVLFGKDGRRTVAVFSPGAWSAVYVPWEPKDEQG